jgi:hypothetical protein
MRMYYHSFDAARGKFVVGLATSADGFKWTKQGPIFEVCMYVCVCAHARARVRSLVHAVV